LREVLESLELVSFVKTTGGKGLHVVVPLARRHDWDAVKEYSREIATQMARAAPKLYIATASKAQRKGKIFVDYLRNARGATAVAPFSTRAKPGAPVSMPVAWEELGPKLRSDTFTVENVAERFRGRGARDPWAELFQIRQSLKRSGR
jgi:bifunctional non-homologous end joining protein LigD